MPKSKRVAAKAKNIWVIGAAVSLAALFGGVWLIKTSGPISPSISANHSTGAVINVIGTSGSNAPIVNQSSNININQGTQFIGTNALIIQVFEQMKNENDQKSDQLAKKFPLGYAIFSFLETREILPFSTDTNMPLVLDWHQSAGVTMTRENLEFKLPGVNLPGVTLDEVSLSMPRVEGASFSIAFGSHGAPRNWSFKDNAFGSTLKNDWVQLSTDPSYMLVAQLLKTKEFGAVMVLGAARFTAELTDGMPPFIGIATNLAKGRVDGP